MRFVETKTVEQQSRAAVFRGRERLVHQRTADMNALRALLYEHGHVFPAGIRYLDRMTALAEEEASNLPALIREECLDLLAQIAEKTARISERTAKLKTLAAQSERARRLQTVPGVGPLTAVAVEAFGPDMAQFKTGRDFAAWLFALSVFRHRMIAHVKAGTKQDAECSATLTRLVGEKRKPAYPDLTKNNHMAMK